jgi:A/G-specific adenine glycosylase
MNKQVPRPLQPQSLPARPQQVSAIQTAMLAWYQQHRRDLPWRQTRDPYAILVAEVMLQQTQVDRVLPKFGQFMHRYPTIQDLAAAPLAELITEWYPLGYNRRPVRLRAIARQITEEHRGQFPQTFDGLIALEGVGPYTAGAILCFAYEQDVAIIDTNIRRIVHRWLLGPDLPHSLANDRQLQPLAEHMLPAGQGYHWNQALMDFGSAVCKSQDPQCQICPVQAHCAAFPAILGQRRLPDQKTQKFTDSNRYYRGKVLRVLVISSLPASQLGLAIKPDFDPVNDAQWLQQLLDGLTADGLVKILADKKISLP